MTAAPGRRFAALISSAALAVGSLVALSGPASAEDGMAPPVTAPVGIAPTAALIRSGQETPQPLWPHAQVALSDPFWANGGSGTTADVLLVDAAGNLFRRQAVRTCCVDRTAPPRWDLLAPEHLGAGWSGRTLYAPGDWDGDRVPDLFSTTADGRLWLHEGSGAGTVLAPVQVGHGWTGIRIIPVGDLTRDGRQDLLAIDAAGRLFAYAGLPGGAFAKRVQVGHGWSGWTLHAGGDQNGDGRPDIFGIDGGARLWFYAGTGPGTFAKKVQVGRGWSGMTFASGEDLQADGRVDLVGMDRWSNLHVYTGLGSGRFSAPTSSWSPDFSSVADLTTLVSSTVGSCVLDGTEVRDDTAVPRWRIEVEWTASGGQLRALDRVLYTPRESFTTTTTTTHVGWDPSGRWVNLDLGFVPTLPLNLAPSMSAGPLSVVGTPYTQHWVPTGLCG